MLAHLVTVFSNHGKHFEHHSGCYHGGHLVWVIFGWHQANHIAPNNIHTAHSVQQSAGFINRETADAGFEVCHSPGAIVGSRQSRSKVM